MSHYYIYAADYSASTNGDAYYNDNGITTLEKFKKELPETNTNIEVVYLQWGEDCIRVNEDDVTSTYLNRSGKSNDTLVHKVIEWVRMNLDLTNGKIKLLYIVTDGQMNSMNVQESIQMNKDIMYEDVVFYAYNRYERAINLSVAVSFFKKKCRVIRNDQLVDAINIEQDFDYDSITIQTFLSEKSKLISYIRLKFITSSKSDMQTITEIEKLKKLRKRLFQEFAGENEKNTIKIFNEVRDANTFIKIFKNSGYYRECVSEVTIKIDIDKCISTLINYLMNEKKSFEFDALKYEVKYDDCKVEETPLPDMSWPDEEKVDFPDIIGLDDSKNIAVILLAKLNLPSKIIFHSGKEESSEKIPASFSKLKSLTDCPLFLLSDKQFTYESICYFYTADVYRQLIEHNDFKDPHTRRSFSGGIILSQACDKYNDYIIATSYFDAKAIPYNKGLFYYVLWKICEGKQWMNTNVLEKFKQYMLRRVVETKCFIGLSSLPLDPLIVTSLPAALWYCVEISSYIFKDDNKNYSKERLRMYHGIAKHMIDIIQMLDYANLNLTFINSRIDMFKYITILKRIPTSQEKYYYIASIIFKQVDGFLISEIAHPENINKLNYLQLNHKNKLNEEVLKNSIDLEHFVFFLNWVDDIPECKICRDTFRPNFVTSHTPMRSFYPDLLNKTKRVFYNKGIEYKSADEIDFQRLVSLHKYYVNCVKLYNCYPTLDQYKEYVLKMKKFVSPIQGKELILPAIFPTNIIDDIKFVYAMFGDVIQGVDVSDFIAKSQQTASRVERIKKETDGFDNDDAIHDFISKEQKVTIRTNSR